MSAYVAGNQHAFTHLYKRLGPRLHSFFLRSFGSAAVAEDLVQTTMLKLHRARSDYMPGRRLRPWLFAIAARVRLDELRRIYRIHEDMGEEELARAMEGQVGPGSDIASVHREERAQAVHAALARLPESQRVVVHLHRFEGMTFPEIAEALGTTEGAVKLRAFRAYERLRKDLANFMTEEAA